MRDSSKFLEWSLQIQDLIDAVNENLLNYSAHTTQENAAESAYDEFCKAARIDSKVDELISQQSEFHESIAGSGSRNEIAEVEWQGKTYLESDFHSLALDWVTILDEEALEVVNSFERGETDFHQFNESVNSLSEATSALLAKLDRERASVQLNLKSSADNPKKSHPKNPDVRDLCALLAKPRPNSESANEIARQFTNGDENKAANLLRQARRFKHLWQ